MIARAMTKEDVPACTAILKRPAENLNRWDSHGADFVIHPVWEDGSCQHHCRKRFVRGFRY